MNIYVGNLHYDVESEDLKELFIQLGEVSSAKVIKDRETGRSSGYGFVEMDNDEEGKVAISRLDQFEWEGRKIRVSEARPRADRRQRSNNRY
ncbi:MAG: RNA-binding protein [Bacteroidales bacterium]|jgi:RNA recognition motif-containing protein|nr:RNA-binding protein [Bacteroidales bacterium]